MIIHKDCTQNQGCTTPPESEFAQEGAITKEKPYNNRVANPASPILSSRISEGESYRDNSLDNAILLKWGLQHPHVAPFHLELKGDKLRYPVILPDGSHHSRIRIKNLNNSHDEKYKWNYGSDTVPLYYNEVGFAFASGGDLIVSGGEPNTWVLAGALGQPNVINWFGELTIPEDFVERCQQHNIRRVMAWPDRDDTGRKMAQNLANKLLVGSGVDLVTFELPFDSDSKKDFADYWVACQPCTADEFIHQLYNLPVMKITPEKRTSKPTARCNTPTYVDTSNPSELHEIERLTRLEIAAALEKRGSKEGYYNCPLEHGPQGKDFLFNVEPGTPIGGCMGKHQGQLRRWKDLAEYLGIDVSAIARQVREANRQNTEHNRVYAKLSTKRNKLEANAVRFTDGFPRALINMFMGDHQRYKTAKDMPKVPDLIAPGIVWQAWHDLNLPNVFTVADLEQAANDAGETFSKGAVDKNLNRLVKIGVFRSFDPICSDYIGSSQQKTSPCNKKQNGRPKRLYEAVPLQEALPALAAYRSQLAFEHCYRNIPANARLVADKWLTDHQLARVEHERAAVYRAFEIERQNAATAWECERSNIHNACDLVALQNGKRTPSIVDLAAMSPSGYRKALFELDFVELGGLRSHTRKQLCALYGVSANALKRIRESLEITSVPQYGEFVVCEDLPLVEQIARNQYDWALKRGGGQWVTDGYRSQRLTADTVEDAEKFIRSAVNQGKQCAVRVQLRSIEKYTAALDDIDRQTIQEQQERNQKFAAIRRRRCKERALQTSQLSDIAVDRIPLLPFAIKQATYSLPHGIRIKGGALLVTDNLTGGIKHYELTPENVWLAAVDALPDNTLYDELPPLVNEKGTEIEADTMPHVQSSQTEVEESQSPPKYIIKPETLSSPDVLPVDQAPHPISRVMTVHEYWEQQSGGLWEDRLTPDPDRVAAVKRWTEEQRRQSQKDIATINRKYRSGDTMRAVGR